MKRIIAIIFLIVISFGLGEKNEFVPDEAFFQQVVKKYDTDVNLSQYRFRFYEKKPNVNNAAEFYDYEYEIVSSGKIVRSVYYIKVIRRCPSRPSFAPPIYIDFLMEIKSETSYRYISVTNDSGWDAMTVEDVVMNAAKTYDQAVPGCNYPNAGEEDFYVRFLQYAGYRALETMYSTAERSRHFEYDNKTYSVPAFAVERISHDNFSGKEKIGSEYYDKSTDSYVLPMKIYENFYELEITQCEKIGRNLYRAEIERKHSLTEEIDPAEFSMVVEINGDSYRYLSVKYK